MNQLKVSLPGGGDALVPIRFAADPAQTEIGPLPPEVAEHYEVRIIPSPFLLRKPHEGKAPDQKYQAFLTSVEGSILNSGTNIDYEAPRPPRAPLITLIVVTALVTLVSQAVQLLRTLGAIQ